MPGRKRLTSWMRTRRVAIGASVLIHAGAIAYLTVDRPSTVRQQEVTIEFIAETRESEPVVTEPTVTEAPRVTALGRVPEDPPVVRAVERSQSGAFEAILAMDLGSLRSGHISRRPIADGRPGLATGIGVAEPDVHLTVGEVDSLISADPGTPDAPRKRGVRGRPIGPVCIPPR